MAISQHRTLLALDEYARIMSIPGWHFAQVTHPLRPANGSCDLVWLQNGYSGDPNRIVGRDEVAAAIMVAEKKMADAAGFFMAPMWVQNEEHVWELPPRGTHKRYPKFRTNWGHLISAGVERWDLIGLYETPIVYSDRDGDGVLDWATIIATLGAPHYLYYTAAVDCALCELAVVPTGQDPTLREWRIRPLQITNLGAQTYRIEGPRWMFIRPEEWWLLEPVAMSENLAFLNAVDVYCHYNYTGAQAIYRWRDPACTTIPCSTLSQAACVTVTRSRTGHFYAQTADHSASGWAEADWPTSEDPDTLNIFYLAGYRDLLTGPCDWMGEALKTAIARLANVYLAEAPCGCGLTRERWDNDREEMDINTVDVAMAQTMFGTTARGAVFAYSVLKTLPPLGKGG